jgi:hypothetical protein
MKLKRKLLTIGLALSLGATLLLPSCKKDKDQTPDKQKSSYRSFAEWRQSLSVPKQTFTLNASTGGNIRGDRGYDFTIAPGTLIDGFNNPVTGNVVVELTEVTNAYEMAGTGAGTLADDGILSSVGMFNLRITQGGNPVFVNPNQPIQAMVTTNENATMDGVSLFRGNNTIDSSNNDSRVVWTRDADSTIRFNADSIRNVWDSIQRTFIRKRCIRFELKFLSWCNLDRYINNPNGETIRIEIPGIADHVDTRVFIYLDQDNLKGLVNLFFDGQGSNNQNLYSSRFYKLPLGWKIRVIVATLDKDFNLTYETRLITNTTGAVHEFKDLKPVSDAELEMLFRSLQ